MKVLSVTRARNEEKYLHETILSLKQQTIPLQIIFVNDGSTDSTADIAEKLGCIVVNLPHHKESYAGRPELAEIINAGLRRVNEDVDYILLVDADHPLPLDYVERLVSKMEANPKLVVTSGRIEGEPYFESAPRDSGRLVKTSFWREASNLQYPVVWGWGGWLLLKAMQMGYETKCFRDITTKIARPTRLGSRKASYWGKAMYALGYDWKYVLGRCILTFYKSPKAGLSMFWGWIRHKDVQRLGIANWVNQMQKRQFWNRVWRYIKRGGRK